MKLAELYYSVQRLRSTPGDLLFRYFLEQGMELAGRLVGDRWFAEKGLKELLGIPQRGPGERERSGDERIEHIAFHPTIMVLAMSTSYARVHLFDLRTNTFLDYYLVAADDPREVGITSLAFNKMNQLAVGLGSGCVDVWSVDLSAPGPKEWGSPRRLGPLFEDVKREGESGSPFGYRGSPSKVARRGFFETEASPGTMGILRKRVEARKAVLERVELVPEGFGGQGKLVGEVTVVGFSPSGKYLAVGTEVGGVWVYNLTQESSFQVYTGFVTSAKCTCLVWGVPPDVRRLPLKNGGVPLRYQNETGDTALIVGMENGLIVYIQIRENGVSGIIIDSTPIEFYPGRMIGVGDKGISQVLLVPSSPAVEGVEKLYASFPTLVVSFVESPGIHIFRLVPESLLKASVPSAASMPTTPADTFLGSYSQMASQQLYETALGMAEKILGDFYGAHDRMEAVHVGTLDTSYVVFLPSRRDATSEGSDGEIPRPRAWEGYGGAVKSMAIDPTARRLIVSFSSDKGKGLEDSVVWFDASAITSSTSVLGALEVLRPQRVMSGDDGGGVGEVHFAGGFEAGACAGMVVGGGKGVSVFPAWIGAGDDEGLGEYSWGRE